MKKAFMIMLSCTMLVVLLSSCSGKNEPNNAINSPESSATETAKSSTATDEPKEEVVQEEVVTIKYVIPGPEPQE